eukprot:jgi/Tetstr1/439654/TSEL_028075.t1
MVLRGADGADGDDRLRVVVVSGSTGVGKSKLAVDLAAANGGEVVNADALQLYAGLAVTTNQATAEEMAGVPHHMMGFLPPSAVEYTAQQFRDAAVPLIEDICARGKLPFIVGGSNYYVQALVSQYLLDERPAAEPRGATTDGGSSDSGSDGSEVGVGEDERGEDGGSLHERLRQVDEAAAARLHPNDHRKIRRYLDIYRQTGQRPSDLYRSQAGAAQKLRYRCCWLWLDSAQEPLDAHLSARVGGMLARGLLAEVRGLLAGAGNGGDAARFGAGLRQAIGVREFEAYFAQLREEGQREAAPEVASAAARGQGDWPAGESGRLLREATAAYVTSTGRLARRQRRRLRGLAAAGEWPLRRLDASAVFCAMYEGGGCEPAEAARLWRQEVLAPAQAAVAAFLAGEERDAAGLDAAVATRTPDHWVKRTCEICDGRVLRGDNEWEAHVKGRNHKKRAAAHRRRERQLTEAPQVAALRRAAEETRTMAGCAGRESHPQSIPKT